MIELCEDGILAYVAHYEGEQGGFGGSCVVRIEEFHCGRNEGMSHHGKFIVYQSSVETSNKGA